MNHFHGTPHDHLIQSTFRHLRHAASWLRWLLPGPLVPRVDWTSGRLLPDRLRGSGQRYGIADSVFEFRFVDAECRLLIAFEHRSFQHPNVHDTLLRYSVYLAQTAARERTAPAAAVLAVALYHGPGRPVLQPRLAATFDPETAELLRSLQPHILVLLDDLSRCDEAQIQARPLTPLVTLTLLAVRFLPHWGAADTLAALDRWGPLLRAVDRDEGPPTGAEAIATLGWYILHVNETPLEDLHMALERNLQRPEETIMSTATRIQQEGEARGRAETLLRLLGRRFGVIAPELTARVRAASIDDLDRWTDRVLDAATLEAVFATG